MTDLSIFRVYEQDECGADGYPLAWHDLGDGKGVKHLVRELAEHRCRRCMHPYECGKSNPEWSRCDRMCRHKGPIRWQRWEDDVWVYEPARGPREVNHDGIVEAARRVLTVHHLRLGHDHKRDLRWWNLVALCQRCHLSIQGKVQLERVWPHEHTPWFMPYAAGWYAWSYLGENLTKAEVIARLPELLALERQVERSAA